MEEYGRSITAILKDSQGYIWSGGWATGLNRLDEKTGEFINYRSDPNDPNSLLIDNIATIFEDSNNNLWIGTYSGLNRFDRETEQFTAYVNDPNDPNSIGAGTARAIYESRSGELLIGTSEGGVGRFEPETGMFYPFTDYLEKAVDIGISFIHEDSDGTLWLATSRSLNKFDRETGSFTRYTEQQGLPSVFIAGILEDETGNLWLSTLNGLSRFDPKTETFRNYDKKDGLADNSFSTGCYFQTQNGEMHFCSNSGFIAFRPENIKDNPYAPPVVITEFKLFNNPVPIEPDSILQQPIMNTDQLTLSYRDKVFSFEFAALSFANPEKNRYRYMMSGFETKWNEVNSTQRLATYTNLDPGNYTFHVQGSNSDGVWNDVGVSLPIIITPPWWQTTSAYILYTLSAIMAVFGLVKWRTSSIEKRNQALQNQAKRVSNILDTVPTGLVIIDSTYRVIAVNPIAKKELYAIANSGINETITHLGNQPIEKLLESPIEGMWHEVTVNEQPSPRYFAVIARSIIDENNPKDWVLAFRDITIERSVQEKAAAQQRLASIGSFTAGIAHDLNNMLAVILLNVYMLRKLSSLNSKSKHQLERISNQAEDANRLVEQILAFSRKTVMERRAIDLSMVIQKQSDLLSQLLTSEFTLKTTFDESEDYHIYGDSIQIQQILTNLVTNARDAMPHGGAIEIRLATTNSAKSEDDIELSPHRNWVTVAVSDEGVGIPDDILPNIFEPFVTTKPTGKGTGLGLAQIFGIVKQHNGFINVQTKINEGSEFILYFPKYDGNVLYLAPEFDSVDVPQGNNEVILIVEDNSALLETLGESLRDINYRVLSASDGQEALDIWRKNYQSIDLVLTDTVMPNMSGVGLFNALKKAGSKQPIIFMTGHLLEHEAELQFETLRQQGLTDWVRKPVYFDELANLLAKVLQEPSE